MNHLPLISALVAVTQVGACKLTSDGRLPENQPTSTLVTSDISSIRVCAEVQGDRRRTEPDEGSGVRHPQAAHSVFDPDLLWPQGRRILVKFLGGSPDLHRRIQQTASKWTCHTSISFEYVSEGNADLRIGFDPNSGSWSYVGPRA